MPSASALYGGRWLSANDVQNPFSGFVTEAGTTKVREDDGTSRERIELRIEGAAKPVLINATNAQRMVEAFGDDFSQWVGHLVRVGVEQVIYNGKRVPGLRLQPIKDDAQAVAATENPNPVPF